MKNYEEIKAKELHKIRLSLEMIAEALQPIARAYDNFNNVEEPILDEENKEEE